MIVIVIIKWSHVTVQLKDADHSIGQMVQVIK